MASKEFLDLISKMTEVHVKKSADYAADNDAYSNFAFAADLVCEFEGSMDKVFVCMIGIKMARLANLLNSKKAVQNESIEDSFIDLANYCLLWASWYKQANNPVRVTRWDEGP